ncbi:hypothetical protein NZD89_02455 [Alicyclobacillus fastidiosus]|uniref:Uncharacterized protein n=1 Tax=Alicyclobacillus fastidiosus TaxID=392011 RepID=A0ABY6ZJY7_9BACL|nr:hypothetical protein [Alicyclobacillus fastidiosus]WAH42386.1 hypothetical protein NZD89_02455 [Alicyclobacillus fastidiosus]GMA64202.1 hypothetical protein GCM10025859_46420 [Alicyclobacillus fastidiosus]
MTTMQNIMERLDDLRNQVFLHSLTSKSIDELLNMRQEALDLKESFLNCSFIGTEVEVLDTLRVEIMECELTTHILASEAMYQDTQEQIQKLSDLYQMTLM